MMNDRMEQIEKLRERANVSYEEAKDTLERFNYDLLEAMIYLEKQNKVRPPKGTVCNGIIAVLEKALNFAEKIIAKGNQTRLVLSKDNATVINLPMTIVVLATLLFPPFTFVGLLVALFTNHKVRFEGAEKNEPPKPPAAPVVCKDVEVL